MADCGGKTDRSVCLAVCYKLRKYVGVANSQVCVFVCVFIVSYNIRQSVGETNRHVCVFSVCYKVWKSAGVQVCVFSVSYNVQQSVGGANRHISVFVYTNVRQFMGGRKPTGLCVIKYDSPWGD